VATRLREVRDRDGAHHIAALVSARASNEEAYLFARLFREGLPGSLLAGVAWSPADAYRDDLLIDADKNPNTNGLRALGVNMDAQTVLRAVETGEVKTLVLCRADLAAIQGEAWLDRVAEQLDFLVVIDTDGHPTAEAADVLLPVATYVEAAGTFVNRQRRVQLARQAFIPPGRVQEGWLVLSELNRRIAGWDLHSSAEAVFREIAARASAFAGLDYTTIGLHGVELRA